jgi:hypothetical protein
LAFRRITSGHHGSVGSRSCVLCGGAVQRVHSSQRRGLWSGPNRHPNAGPHPADLYRRLSGDGPHNGDVRGPSKPRMAPCRMAAVRAYLLLLDGRNRLGSVFHITARRKRPQAVSGRIFDSLRGSRPVGRRYRTRAAKALAWCVVCSRGDRRRFVERAIRRRGRADRRRLFRHSSARASSLPGDHECRGRAWRGRADRRLWELRLLWALDPNAARRRITRGVAWLLVGKIGSCIGSTLGRFPGLSRPSFSSVELRFSCDSAAQKSQSEIRSGSASVLPINVIPFATSSSSCRGPIPMRVELARWRRSGHEQ